MATAKRQPVAGVDYDPNKGMCQDDYEWFSSTGQYAGNGWAEWKEREEAAKPAPAKREAWEVEWDSYANMGGACMDSYRGW